MTQFFVENAAVICNAVVYTLYGAAAIGFCCICPILWTLAKESAKEYIKETTEE